MLTFVKSKYELLSKKFKFTPGKRCRRAGLPEGVGAVGSYEVLPADRKEPGRGGMVKKFFKVGIGPPGLFLCVKTLKIRRIIFTRTES